MEAMVTAMVMVMATPTVIPPTEEKRRKKKGAITPTKLSSKNFTRSIILFKLRPH
jgi:hypothetical protein